MFYNLVSIREAFLRGKFPQKYFFNTRLQVKETTNEDGDNPKNISEVERVKWIISRIDLHHKNILESIDSGQAIFQNEGEKGLNKIKSQRRGIFSVLVAVLSVTFGINSFQPLEIWMLYSILSILSTVGVLNYLLFGWVGSFTENGFGLIFAISNESRNRIAESQSFVTTQFADLGFLDLTKIKNYGVFTLLLQIATQVNMMNELKKEKSYKTSWLAVTLKEQFKVVSETTKQVPELFERFDDTQPLPKSCFDLIEKTLKKYSNKKK